MQLLQMTWNAPGIEWKATRLPKKTLSTSPFIDYWPSATFYYTKRALERAKTLTVRLRNFALEWLETDHLSGHVKLDDFIWSSGCALVFKIFDSADNYQFSKC
jgi:hypothetical protein